MARKFKVGDTVEVVKEVVKTEETLNSGFNVGHRGKVIGYMSGLPYPYKVQRRNGTNEVFTVEELKLIRKGTKNGTN